MKISAIIFFLMLGVAAAARDDKPTQSPLPPMSGAIVDHLEDALWGVKYPIRFRELFEKLGGDKALVWCSYRDSGQYTIATFAATVPNANEGRYEVQFEFRPALVGPPTDAMCINARLAYSSAYGHKFYQERDSEKRPNQSSEPTPTSVTTPAAQEIAPAAVMAHL